MATVSADRTRQWAVAIGALLQIAAGFVGGTGLIAERIGSVANANPTRCCRRARPS